MKTISVVLGLSVQNGVSLSPTNSHSSPCFVSLRFFKECTTPTLSPSWLPLRSCIKFSPRRQESLCQRQRSVRSEEHYCCHTTEVKETDQNGFREACWSLPSLPSFARLLTFFLEDNPFSRILFRVLIPQHSRLPLVEVTFLRAYASTTRHLHPSTICLQVSYNQSPIIPVSSTQSVKTTTWKLLNLKLPLGFLPSFSWVSFSSALELLLSTLLAFLTSMTMSLQESLLSTLGSLLESESLVQFWDFFSGPFVHPFTSTFLSVKFSLLSLEFLWCNFLEKLKKRAVDFGLLQYFSTSLIYRLGKRFQSLLFFQNLCHSTLCSAI